MHVSQQQLSQEHAMTARREPPAAQPRAAAVDTRDGEDAGLEPQHRRRWLILAVIGLAQLMATLDLTIVNVALPSAQHDLGFSTEARQWIITAYALALGSLLLLGG